MGFDLKMDFTRKARWVAAGHKTPDPIRSAYAGVVSRESVRIAFTYAALNGLDVWAADIRNAYLQARQRIECSIDKFLSGRQAEPKILCLVGKVYIQGLQEVLSQKNC